MCCLPSITQKASSWPSRCSNRLTLSSLPSAFIPPVSRSSNPSWWVSCKVWQDENESRGERQAHIEDEIRRPVCFVGRREDSCAYHNLSANSPRSVSFFLTVPDQSDGVRWMKTPLTYLTVLCSDVSTHSKLFCFLCMSTRHSKEQGAGQDEYGIARILPDSYVLFRSSSIHSIFLKLIFSTSFSISSVVTLLFPLSLPILLPLTVVTLPRTIAKTVSMIREDENAQKWNSTFLVSFIFSVLKVFFLTRWQSWVDNLCFTCCHAASSSSSSRSPLVQHTILTPPNYSREGRSAEVHTSPRSFRSLLLIFSTIPVFWALFLWGPSMQWVHIILIGTVSKLSIDTAARATSRSLTWCNSMRNWNKENRCVKRRNSIQYCCVLWRSVCPFPRYPPVNLSSSATTKFFSDDDFKKPLTLLSRLIILLTMFAACGPISSARCTFLEHCIFPKSRIVHQSIENPKSSILFPEVS